MHYSIQIKDYKTGKLTLFYFQPQDCEKKIFISNFYNQKTMPQVFQIKEKDSHPLN